MDTREILNKLVAKLRQNWKLYNEATRSMAVESIETELGEMENIFGLLVLGSFIGLPTPPMQITLDMLPEMETHFALMLNKVDMATEPISNLLSTFDVM